MKIVFMILGNDMSVVFDSCFGRAACFLMYDMDLDLFIVIDNV